MLPSYLSERRRSLERGQQGISRPVAFRLHLTMDLALYRKRFELPTGKPRPIRSKADPFKGILALGNLLNRGLMVG